MSRASGTVEQRQERRSDIVVRQQELSREFASAHGRAPTPTEEVALAQQGNSEARDAKHEPRSYADQRTLWLAETIGALGSARDVARMVSAALHLAQRARQGVSAAWVRATATLVVTEQRIVATAGRCDEIAWSSDDVELSVPAVRLDEVRPNRGQEAW